MRPSDSFLEEQRYRVEGWMLTRRDCTYKLGRQSNTKVDAATAEREQQRIKTHIPYCLFRLLLGSV